MISATCGRPAFRRPGSTATNSSPPKRATRSLRRGAGRRWHLGQPLQHLVAGEVVRAGRCIPFEAVASITSTDTGRPCSAQRAHTSLR